MKIKAHGCHKGGEIHGEHGCSQVMAVFREKFARTDRWIDK